MDLKSKILYVGRVEDNENQANINDNENSNKEGVSNVKEKVTLIGKVEDNEHFESEPKAPSAALHSLLDAYSKKKTTIFEVN